MPEVALARVYVPDAILALQRANEAWNKTQLLDAIQSAETFIAAAKAAISVAQTIAQPTGSFAMPGSPNFQRQALQRAIDKCAANAAAVSTQPISGQQ